MSFTRKIEVPCSLINYVRLQPTVKIEHICDICHQRLIFSFNKNAPGQGNQRQEGKSSWPDPEQLSSLITQLLSGVRASSPQYTDLTHSALHNHYGSETDSNTPQLCPPSTSLLLQQQGSSSEVYSPSKVSEEVSRSRSVRRPKKVLVGGEVLSRLFERGGRTEGKSMSKKQEAYDGMANRFLH